MSNPDFKNRLLKTIFCEGEADRVPIMEAGIARPIKERFLGRTIITVEDEIEFWAAAGYDFIPLEAGLRTIIDAAIHHEETGRFERNVPDPPIVAAAKLFAVEKLSGYGLTTVNDDGSPRSWAPEGQGIINSLQDLADFPWPAAKDMDYSLFETIRGCLPPGMGVLCNGGAIFSSVMLMMGVMNCLLGMTRGTELFTRLLQRVEQFQLDVIDVLLETGGVDGIWINDDMGFQSGPLVNPKLYEQYTFPIYREIKRRVARKSLPLLLHSDGNITKLLPALAKIGFNAIHPIQPECMDILKARELVGDHVCLIGNLSLGFPLGTGTPEDVVRETTLLIRKAAPGGKYCFSSGNSIPDYVPYENWLAMRNTALQVGTYPVSA